MKLDPKKLGLLGFGFFLLKGLLWLALPAMIAAWTLLSDSAG